MMLRLGMTIFLLISVGCTRYAKEVPTGAPMRVDNVYANPYYDHSKLLNVLILPVDNFMERDELEFHRSQLTTAILRNWGKFNYFNVQFDPHYMETAGRIVDVDTGRLDRSKLGEVGRTYGAHAVLQISIDEFRPFPPMRMKVKAVLLDANTGERAWSFDHTFDSDDAEVVNALRYWWNTRMAGGDPRNRFEVSRVRPSVFANFVFYTMARSYGEKRVRNVEVIAEEKERMDKEISEPGSH
jgi:hypothetical protein